MSIRTTVFAAIAAAGLAGAVHAASPIDVCRLVTKDDATKLLGPLPMQPPAQTDNVGFGISACLYIGPALSGQGAQTKHAQLFVQAGRGKGAADMLQDDVAKKHAPGTFATAKSGDAMCTAEIKNGLPPKLTPDAAAAGLNALCEKVLAAR